MSVSAQTRGCNAEMIVFLTTKVEKLENQIEELKKLNDMLQISLRAENDRLERNAQLEKCNAEMLAIINKYALDRKVEDTTTCSICQQEFLDKDNTGSTICSFCESDQCQRNENWKSKSKN